jgi:hypothetical protein
VKARSLRASNAVGTVSEPVDILSLFAELTIGVAGFSGIVVVLGRRQSGQLSPLDQNRLGNLLKHALAALFWSLFTITLLQTALSAEVLWRGVSAGWALAGAIWLARDWSRLRALSETEWVRISRLQLVALDGAAVLVVLLQVSNSAYFHAFWPFVVALSFNVLLAFRNFAALLYSEFRAA